MGMDSMKKAMLKVMRNGSYTFTDSSNPNQTYLFDYMDELKEEKLGAESIFEKFRGQTVISFEIQDYVLGVTPFRKWKAMLKV